jgi:ABC-2 type transport system permease protein
VTAVPEPGPPPTPNAPVKDRVSIRFQSDNPTNDAFPRWADRVVNEIIIAVRCEAEGLSRAKVKGIVQPAQLRIKDLVKRNPTTGALEEGSDEDRVAMFIVPAALMALMFLVVMVGATPLMQGVMEEKMQRIAEVLLGSVTPFELMLGKLLGMMGVALTLAGVYLGGAYWAVRPFGYTELLPTSLLLWFVVYLALAVVMYGSLFIAVGAACTDAKESQTLMMPVVMLIMIPIFTVQIVMMEPNSSVAMWLSLFPFATPMLMITRIGLPSGIPIWQPLLGVVGVLATTIACVYAAGRIFRVGILMQGKGARFSDLAKWVFRG